MNPVTNPKNKKIIKIISLIAVLAGVFIIILFFISSKVFPDYSFFDLLFVPVELRTTLEHQKALGIETAKISGAEVKKLDSMINESVKAQLEYYSTEKDDSLEKVRNLYLPSGFEQYKKDVKFYASYPDSKNIFYNKIENVKFNKPVTYQVLPGRIGIINLISFKDKYTNNLEQLFIFQNINGEWKIERQREIAATPDIDENILIQEINNEK